jgi:D-threonate/D-erythronate kinase
MCDDLTGAMEAGLQICKRGYRAYIIPDYHSFGSSLSGADMYVINTESRNVSVSEAAHKIDESLRIIGKGGSSVIYKKIDSTLRGNVGKEIEAIINHTNAGMIILAPALPFNGRTTKQGFHYLNGKKLTESDLAKDPFSPIEDSFIPDILRKQTDLKSKVILIEEVRKGEQSLAQRIQMMYAEGIHVVVIDSETEKDLEIVSSAVSMAGLKLLPCGSAALFSKIMDHYDKPAECVSPHKGKNPLKPVFILSGSPAMASKNQIKYAAANGIHLIKLDMHKIQSESDNNDFERMAVEDATNMLNQGKSVIVDGAGDGKSEIAAQYHGDRQSLVSDSERIHRFLSRIFRDITSASDISGAMIIGGDTLQAVCKGMSVGAIRITGEVEPFVPAGVMISGGVEGLSVVSKAGGFGGEDIIVKTILHLQG